MMLLNIVNKELPVVNLTEAGSTESVKADGCQTLAFALEVTEDSALTGASVKIEKALEEGGPWFEDAAATNITETANFYLEASQPIDGRFYRLTFALDAGELTASTHVVGKGLT